MAGPFIRWERFCFSLSGQFAGSLSRWFLQAGTGPGDPMLLSPGAHRLSRPWPLCSLGWVMALLSPRHSQSAWHGPPKCLQVSVGQPRWAGEGHKAVAEEEEANYWCSICCFAHRPQYCCPLSSSSLSFPALNIHFDPVLSSHFFFFPQILLLFYITNFMRND